LSRAQGTLTVGVRNGSFVPVPRCPGWGRFAQNNCRDVAVLRTTRCAKNRVIQFVGARSGRLAITWRDRITLLGGGLAVATLLHYHIGLLMTSV
jgi:hypothetical protein